MTITALSWSSWIYWFESSWGELDLANMPWRVSDSETADFCDKLGWPKELTRFAVSKDSGLTVYLLDSLHRYKLSLSLIPRCLKNEICLNEQKSSFKLSKLFLQGATSLWKDLSAFWSKRKPVNYLLGPIEKDSPSYQSTHYFTIFISYVHSSPLWIPRTAGLCVLTLNRKPLYHSHSKFYVSTFVQTQSNLEICISLLASSVLCQVHEWIAKRTWWFQTREHHICFNSLFMTSKAQCKWDKWAFTSAFRSLFWVWLYKSWEIKCRHDCD